MIRILAEQNMEIGYNSRYIPIVFICVGLAFICFFLFAAFFGTEKAGRAILCFSLAALFGVAAAFIYFTTREPIIEPRYTLLIDDDAKFKEVYNKYDILYQNGEMYIARPKDID